GGPRPRVPRQRRGRDGGAGRGPAGVPGRLAAGGWEAAVPGRPAAGGREAGRPEISDFPGGRGPRQLVNVVWLVRHCVCLPEGSLGSVLPPPLRPLRFPPPPPPAPPAPPPP